MIFPPVFVLAVFFAGFSRPERILFLINIYISSKIMGVDFHTFASTKTWLIVNFRSLSYNYFCWFLHTWTLRPWHKQPFQFNINKLCVWLLGCFCNFQLWTMNNKVATTCVHINNSTYMKHIHYNVMASRFMALSDYFAQLSYLAFEVKVYQPSCQNLGSSVPFKMIFINFKKQLPLNCTVHNNDIMCYIKVNA